MSSSQPSVLELWNWKKAIAPFFLSISFTFFGLLAVAFPNRFHPGNLLSLVLVLVVLAFAISDELFPDGFLTVFYWRFCFIYIGHVSFLLSSGKSGSSIRGVSDTQPWRRGFKLLFNPRGIRTAWESPATLVKSISNDDLTDTKTRRRLALMKRLATFCLTIVAMSFYHEFFNAWVASYIQPAALDFTPEKISIIRRGLSALLNRNQDLTGAMIAREWIIRLWHTIDEHVAELFWLTAYHDGFAILKSGVLGLDSLREWPPIFGSISCATTMRGFWAHFWHRLMYKSLSYHAWVLCNHVLRIHDHHFVSRYARNFTVFILSGLMHAIVDWRRGAKCALSANMWYWSIQPLAFVIEGVVQYVWMRFLRPELTTTTGCIVLSGLERSVGYAWVLMWLSWSYPKRRFQVIAN